MKPARISEIVDHMNLPGETMRAYFDRETGNVEVVGEDDDAMAEGDDDDAPDWHREAVEMTRLIRADEDQDGGRFVPLPDRFEVHEWSQMERFAASVEGARASQELDRAIRGGGAFRRFKDALHRLGLTGEWYTFRDECYREVAITWCEENNIEVAQEEGAGA